MEAKRTYLVVRWIMLVAIVCLAAGTCWADAVSELERGKNLHKAGRYDEAIACLNQLSTTYSDSDQASECHYWIGICYMCKEAHEQALTSFRAQVSQFPNNYQTPKAALRIGQVYLNIKEYDTALSEFAKVLNSYPEYTSGAQYWTGTCHQMQKKYPEAITAFKAAIAATPVDTPKDEFYLKYSNYRLGECYREVGDWDNGITHYLSLITSYPTDAGCHKMDLAACYMGKKDYPKAIATFEDVIENHQDQANSARLRIDDCLSEQGKHAEQIDYLTKLYNECPEIRPDVMFRRAMVRSDHLKQFSEAIDELELLLTDFPDSWLATTTKAHIAGITLHGLRDTVRARSLLLAFESEFPEYDQMAFIRGDLGTCAYKEGNYLEAARLFEESLTLPGPDGWHPYTLYMIGDCYSRVGNVEKAKEAWNRLMKEYPGDNWIIFAAKHLARIEGR